MPRCGAGGPCVWIRALSQPQRHGRKPWRGVRVVVLLLHALFIGAVFLLDPTLQRQIHEAKWSQPALVESKHGFYVHNSIWVAGFTYLGTIPIYSHFFSRKRQANSKSGSLNSAMSRSKIEQQNPQSTTALLLQQTMDLYPPGTSTSLHAPSTVMTVINVSSNLIIIVFGLEHALLKGTTADFVLTVWTVAFYIQFFYLGIVVSWWKFAIGIVLLVALILILVVLLPLLIFHAYLALTNQTTYEIARRKRISYLREVPSRVHPFSKGICRNLYDLCISKQRGFFLEAVPPLEVLQARARPYTCRDVISCRCC
uniref:S-acyltransferase n=1 Tax=Oryza meridionalis TaxID=40149 RepID=A0A0E0DH35_9ORYZ